MAKCKPLIYVRIESNEVLIKDWILPQNEFISNTFERTTEMYKMQNSFVNISFFCIYSRRSDILEVLTTQEILPFDDDILNLPTAVSPPLPQPSQSRNTTGNNNGFIWVQNYLPIFPESLKLTACFCDYLNYRCQSGDILSNLLHRKVFYDKEESSNNSSSEFSNANTVG